jgi:hypothetical protein
MIHSYSYIHICQAAVPDKQIAGLKLLQGALENFQEIFKVHGIHIEYNCVSTTIIIYQMGSMWKSHIKITMVNYFC